MMAPGTIRTCSTCGRQVECVTEYYWRHLDGGSRCPNQAGGYRPETDVREPLREPNLFDDQSFLNGGY